MNPSASLPPVTPRHGAVGLALVAGLSLLAGMTDAIGFLATGDFVSFMSGNTTRLAADVAAGRWPPRGTWALAIGTFVLGNAGGVLLQRLTRQRACLLLGLLALLLGLAASLSLGHLALLTGVFAMGMVNAVVEQSYGQPIGLTYVTGACRVSDAAWVTGCWANAAAAGASSWCPGWACCSAGAGRCPGGGTGPGGLVRQRGPGRHPRR